MGEWQIALSLGQADVSISAQGQVRTNAVEGKADVFLRKADIGVRMSGSGGKADVLADPPGSPFVAISCHPQRLPKFIGQQPINGVCCQVDRIRRKSHN
jgi:hypothetical protein